MNAPRSISLLCVLGASLVAAPTSARGAPARRFALVFGNNLGGANTTPLRYAESDAQKVRALLIELGGHHEDDVIALFGATKSDVFAGLSNLESRIRAAKDAGQHATLFVYYSGHAQDGALRLGETALDMSALRRRLEASPADMRVGIIDACESGVITRDKGARRGPSFLFDVDDRDAARGVVLISSSAANETSQESDELGGSFFTHHLTSGLRGDADDSGDRRVTLGEAYRYAYDRTVSATADTRSGTQHPTYKYDLEGAGDVVLTELENGRSGVIFEAALEGTFLLFDAKQQQVMAEIAKAAGENRRISLPPGRYVVKKRLVDHLRMTTFDLESNRFYVVDESIMQRVAFEDDYAKGARFAAAETLRIAPRASVAVQYFLSSSARDELFPPVVLAGVGLELGPIFGAHVAFEALVGARSGLELPLGEYRATYDFFEAALALEVAWRMSLGGFVLSAGPRFAGLYFSRVFSDDAALRGHEQDHFGISPALGLGGSRAFGGEAFALVVALDGRVGWLAFGVDENRSLFFGELSLSLGVRL